MAGDVVNLYWDAVKPFTHEGVLSGLAPRRHEMVRKFAWTISAPETVEFVKAHCGRFVVDPMAGTGYWATVLSGRHVLVAASDLEPVGSWFQVEQMDAVRAVSRLDADWVLLLSWPPPCSDGGERVLRAFKGSRVIFMGNSDASCGTKGMWDLLASEWTLTVEHVPVRWSGCEDVVRVYDRKEA